MRMVDSGACSGGLTTIELPAASAGPIFQARVEVGKFQGRTAATTPIGSRTISARFSGPVGETLSKSLSRLSAYQRSVVDDVGQVDLLAVADRLAGVDRVEEGELRGVRLDQVGEAQQHGLADRRGELAPRTLLKGGAGRGGGALDVGDAAVGDRGEHRAGAGLEGVERLARGGVDELAVDEGLGRSRGRQGGQGCHPFLRVPGRASYPLSVSPSTMTAARCPR